MTYAYARVSARDQNLSRQLEAFAEMNIDRKHIFCDKKSGKDFDRTNYLRLVRKLRPGDLLVIKSIDRLGRNYQMIIDEWSRITKTIRADILVLDMPLLDTRQNRNLTGTLIADIVLQLLSYIAQTEREFIHQRHRANIRARQAEGIAAAKKKGVRFGRPPKTYSRKFFDIVFAYENKQITLRDALAVTGMSQSNFYYHLKKCKSNSA